MKRIANFFAYLLGIFAMALCIIVIAIIIAFVRVKFEDKFCNWFTNKCLNECFENVIESEEDVVNMGLKDDDTIWMAYKLDDGSVEYIEVPIE